MVKVKEDLIGRIFGRLTVIEQVEDYISPQGKHRAQYKCRCSCGNANCIIVLKNSLTTGNTISCGCIKREQFKQLQWDNHKKYNEYRFDGDLVIGKCSNSDREFKIDLQDFDKIKNICWCLQEKSKSGEIDRLVGWDIENKKIVRMHIYLGFKNYDHIDCDELNNTRKNLRPATSSQNKMNTKNRKIGESGYRGVQTTSNGKYYARIQFTTYENNIKKINKLNGPVRNDAEEAYIDYLKFAAKYHKSYSSVADDFIKYNIKVEK
jgi:hypothetical protein